MTLNRKYNFSYWKYVLLLATIPNESSVNVVCAFTTSIRQPNKGTSTGWSQQVTKGRTVIKVSSLDDGNQSNINQQKSSSKTHMSTAIPFLQFPDVLEYSTLPGNFGFDPLGLCKNEEDVLFYREAEIRHARLAMLAVVGWPLSELFDRKLASVLDMPSLLDQYDRVPSVLNGGLLEQISPAFWGFCVGLTAAIEQVAISKSRRSQGYDNDDDDNAYFPGNLGFDPLRFYPNSTEGQNNMQLAEIKHGRLAMIAITGFAIQEYVTELGVIDETPFFFTPLF